MFFSVTELLMSYLYSCLKDAPSVTKYKTSLYFNLNSKNVLYLVTKVVLVLVDCFMKKVDHFRLKIWIYDSFEMRGENDKFGK